MGVLLGWAVKLMYVYLQVLGLGKVLYKYRYTPSTTTKQYSSTSTSTLVLVQGTGCRLWYHALYTTLHVGTLEYKWYQMSASVAEFLRNSIRKYSKVPILLYSSSRDDLRSTYKSISLKSTQSFSETTNKYQNHGQ